MGGHGGRHKPRIARQKFHALAGSRRLDDPKLRRFTSSTGLKRDFESPFGAHARRPMSRGFKSGARNHLQANRSLGFCFEILS